jgi:hypothetical protein
MMRGTVNSFCGEMSQRWRRPLVSVEFRAHARIIHNHFMQEL